MAEAMDLFDKLEKELLVELRALKALRKTAFDRALQTASSGVDLNCQEGQLFEIAAVKSVKAEMDMIKGMRVAISGYKGALDGLIGASEKVEQGVSDGRMSLLPKPRVKFSDNNENEPPSLAMRSSLAAGSSLWMDTPKAVKSALKKPKTPIFAPSPALREEPENEDPDSTPTASASAAPEPDPAPSVSAPVVSRRPIMTMPVSPILSNKVPPMLPTYSSMGSISVASSMKKRPVTPPTLSRPVLRGLASHNNTFSWTPKPLNFEDSLM